jgi:hypothetical protein
MRFARRFVDYSNKGSLGSRLRARRFQLIRNMLERASTEGNSRPLRVLDLGGTRKYWNLIDAGTLRRWKVRVTLLNRTMEADLDHPDIFEAMEGDACDLRGFGDGSIDLVHTNSVIEHVGDWANMERMAGEIRRVGKAYYVQTPYFWFPVEPHFVCPLLHWLPLSVRTKIALSASLGTWPRARDVGEAVRAQTSAMLLDRSMFGFLFPDAQIQFEYFMAFPKSLIAIRTSARTDL